MRYPKKKPSEFLLSLFIYFLLSNNNQPFIYTRFVECQKLYESTPAKAIEGCKALLKEENINVAVRKGDLYGFMVEHYVKAHNHKQAYALILELRQEIPNVNLAYYVNTDVLLAIEKSLGVILQVDAASKFSGEEPIDDD